MKKIMYYKDSDLSFESCVKEGEYRFIKTNDNCFDNKNLVKICNSFDDLKSIEEMYDHALVKSDIFALTNINYSVKELSIMNGYHLVKILNKKEVVITERERSMLLLIISGKTCKEICYEMKISEALYFNMKKKLLRKTGLESSQQLLIWAISQLSV